MANRRLVAIAAIAMLSGCAHLDQPACAGSPRTNAEVERTVHEFFDALRTDDAAAFGRVTTSSFDSFDAGKRFSGGQLLAVVKDAHARGVQLQWSIGPLDTKFGCRVAWSSWENVGSAGIPPDVKPLSWLESAVLIREDGRWKIDFFHSQRASAK